MNGDFDETKLGGMERKGKEEINPINEHSNLIVI